MDLSQVHRHIDLDLGYVCWYSKEALGVFETFNEHTPACSLKLEAPCVAVAILSYRHALKVM